MSPGLVIGTVRVNGLIEPSLKVFRPDGLGEFRKALIKARRKTIGIDVYKSGLIVFHTTGEYLELRNMIRTMSVWIHLQRANFNSSSLMRIGIDETLAEFRCKFFPRRVVGRFNGVTVYWGIVGPNSVVLHLFFYTFCK